MEGTFTGALDDGSGGGGKTFPAVVGFNCKFFIMLAINALLSTEASYCEGALQLT